MLQVTLGSSQFLARNPHVQGDFFSGDAQGLKQKFSLEVKRQSILYERQNFTSARVAFTGLIKTF